LNGPHVGAAPSSGARPGSIRSRRSNHKYSSRSFVCRQVNAQGNTLIQKRFKPDRRPPLFLFLLLMTSGLTRSCSADEPATGHASSPGKESASRLLQRAGTALGQSAITGTYRPSDYRWCIAPGCELLAGPRDGSGWSFPFVSRGRARASGGTDGQSGNGSLSRRRFLSCSVARTRHSAVLASGFGVAHLTCMRSATIRLPGTRVSIRIRRPFGQSLPPSQLRHQCGGLQLVPMTNPTTRGWFDELPDYNEGSFGIKPEAARRRECEAPRIGGLAWSSLAAVSMAPCQIG